MKYAKVPSIPGAVSEVIDIENEMPEGSDWYPCSDVVGVAWNFDGSTFTPPTASTPAPSFEQYKAAKEATLSQQASTTILSGYNSSALGSAYHYPNANTDQLNLHLSALASTLSGVDSSWRTLFWCADANDIYAFREHTAAQIQQVLRDARVFTIETQTTLSSLIQTVRAAATTSEVDAVVWPE